MNIILMTTSSACSIFSTRLTKATLFCFALLVSAPLQAQQMHENKNTAGFVSSPLYSAYLQDNITENTFPDPKKVLHRSLIIPGWGQITNKQAWKVPIIYGLIGGLSYYSYWLNENYKDYRAAFYNLNPNTPNDFKFGPTPSYISSNADLNSLRTNRNFYRNRRDFIFITIALSYALNAIDAYVFAHLRSFDVSDDLSMNASFKPIRIHNAQRNFAVPGISVSLNIK